MTSRAALASYFAFVCGGDLLAMGIGGRSWGLIVLGVAILAVPLALVVGALVHLAASVDR